MSLAAQNTALGTAGNMTGSLLRQFEELIVFMRDTPLAPLLVESDIQQAFHSVQSLHKTIQDHVADLETSSANSDKMAHDAASPAPQLKPRATLPALANAELSDFSQQRIVGTGTFGTVALVKHRPTKKLYALKVLNKRRIVATRQVVHLRSERDILSKVDHPFVVKIYKTYKDDENVCLLMDHVPGGELFEYIRRAKRFSTSQARFFAAEVVVALAHLHSHGIVYRDLKPENVLLDSEGHIKLIDFGFAKVLEPSERAYTMCGTPEYIAPEVVLSRGHDKSVDWWSLGVLLYEMLMGSPPFVHQERSHLFELIVTGKVRYSHRVDSTAKALCNALLVTEPSNRLGNLRGGVNGIKLHPFFTGFDWGVVERRGLTPPIKPVPSSYRFDPLPPMQLPPHLDVDVDEYFADF